jgi:hypothetical protein
VTIVRDRRRARPRLPAPAPAARGIRQIVQAGREIADPVVARAVQELEERVAELAAHTHDEASPTGSGFSPAQPTRVSYLWKAEDTPFVSATAANVPLGASGVPLMSFDVVAGRRYWFRFVSVVRSDTAGVGVAMTVTTPTATVFAAAGRMVGFAVDGTDAEWVGNITSSGDAVVPTSIVATNTDYLFVVEGVLIPSASGAIVLQARTETGTTTVTVRAGSHGELREQLAG